MINENQSKELIVLAFRAVKLTEDVMVKVIKAYLDSIPEQPVQHGKMKLKDLMQLDQGAKMMEMKADAIGGFKRIASKYNMDFAVTKDKSKDPPLYQVSVSQPLHGVLVPDKTAAAEAARPRIMSPTPMSANTAMAFPAASCTSRVRPAPSMRDRLLPEPWPQKKPSA